VNYFFKYFSILINADTKLINKIKPKAIKFKIRKFALIKTEGCKLETIVGQKLSVFIKNKIKTPKEII
jgi:hypothetical protein